MQYRKWQTLVLSQWVKLLNYKLWVFQSWKSAAASENFVHGSCLHKLRSALRATILRWADPYQILSSQGCDLRHLRKKETKVYIFGEKSLLIEQNFLCNTVIVSCLKFNEDKKRYLRSVTKRIQISKLSENIFKCHWIVFQSLNLKNYLTKIKDTHLAILQMPQQLEILARHCRLLTFPRV